MSRTVTSTVDRLWTSPWTPSGLAALSFLLYLSGVCPYALAGDASMFLIRAVVLTLDSSAQTHPLYLVLGHAFLKLPWSSLPFRLTLMSAIFGATAVGFVFAVVRRLTRNGLSALAGAAALCVAHTMWFHAVVTEVYALNSALLAATLYLAVRWSNSGRPRQLFALAFLGGLACTNHMLAGLSLAVLAIWASLVTWRAKRSFRDLLFAASFALLGATLLIVLLTRDAGLVGPATALGRALTGGTGITGQTTAGYGGAIAGGGKIPLRQMGMSLAAFLYNFPGVSALLGIVGVWVLAKERRPEGLLICALLGVHLLFGATYAVNDFWVFLLPAWVVFSVAVGVGFDRVVRAAAERRPRSSSFIACALVLGNILLPVALYRTMPWLIARVNSPALRARQRAGQVSADKNYWEYYLWPPKSGVVADAEWAVAALEAVPEGGFLLSNEAYLALLQYEQIVEGRRKDIVVQPASPKNAKEALDSGKAVFIAAAANAIEDAVDASGLGARVEPAGPLWKLVRTP